MKNASIDRTIVSAARFMKEDPKNCALTCTHLWTNELIPPAQVAGAPIYYKFSGKE